MGHFVTIKILSYFNLFIFISDEAELNWNRREENEYRQFDGARLDARVAGASRRQLLGTRLGGPYRASPGLKALRYAPRPPMPLNKDCDILVLRSNITMIFQFESEFNFDSFLKISECYFFSLPNLFED